MQFPIPIGLHRSRILDVFLGLIVLLAGVASLAYPAAPIIQASLGLIILALAAFAWRALTPSVTRMRLERNGDILLQLAGAADFVLAQPETGATVHAWLTVIRFRRADGRRVVIIAAPDSLHPADFRRLRMFMRWQANFSALGDAA